MRFPGTSAPPTVNPAPGLNLWTAPHGAFEQLFPPWGLFWLESQGAWALEDTQASIFDGKIPVLECVSIMCLTKTKSCIILLVEQGACSKLVVASHT